MSTHKHESHKRTLHPLAVGASSVPDPKRTNSLLGRIQRFLPELQAANQGKIPWCDMKNSKNWNVYRFQR